MIVASGVAWRLDFGLSLMSYQRQPKGATKHGFQRSAHDHSN